MNDRSADVRAVAAEALGKVGAEPDQAVGVLVQALNDSDWRVRSAVLDSLAQYGPQAKVAVPILMELLNYDDWDSKWKTRYCLARIGARAEDAPKLIARLKSEGPRVMWGPCGPGGYGSSVAGAIKAVGPEAVPFLFKALEDEDANIRAGAAEVLGLFGNPGLPFVAGLDEDLKRRNAPQVCPEAKEALPALKNALSDKSASVRVNAALAVWRLCGETEGTLPVLKEALTDKDPHVRGGAGSALYKMGQGGTRYQSEAIRRAWNAGPLQHTGVCRH
jgi:HEAT repeat protein